MFSFANHKPKPNLLRDSISDPISLAKDKYAQTKTPDDDSGSPYSAQYLQEEKMANVRPSLPCTTTDNDSPSLLTPTKSAKAYRLQKRSARPEYAAGSRTEPDLHQHQLKREKSSSTLRSYYDRRKSPLAVSQQTSASSARDFAFRKACLPAVPTLSLDAPCPQKPETGSTTNTTAPTKRPSRLHFSVLFPKTLHRSEPLPSRKQYTNSHPPLSATSELPSSRFPSQTFLHDRRASELQEPVTTYPKQSSVLSLRSRKPSTARTTVQKPRLGVQNWFDGLEGEISEGDSDYEPEMSPEFIETAFQEACSKVAPEVHFRPDVGPHKDVWPESNLDDQSLRRVEESVSLKATVAEGRQVRHASLTGRSVTKLASGKKCRSMGKGRGSAFLVLDQADLREQSVLCLSSSDDEDDIILHADERGILEHRGPFLRDSLGIDSIDSDVEIGTAQAVTTSFLRTSDPAAKSRGLRGSSFLKGNAKVQRLKAVKIPDRRSSRQGVPPDGHQMILPSSSNSIMGISSVNSLDGEPPSSKSLSVKATPAAQRQTPLIMALTPQEATLLAAMRSKRASMRQNILAEAQRLAVDEDPPHQSVPLVVSSSGKHTEPRSPDHRPVYPNAEPLKAMINCSPNTISTESSLPSEPVSLICSESVSSPTTGCESPPTPTLANQELKVLYSLGSYYDAGQHMGRANEYGHARCRTGSDSIIVLDTFQSSPKENMEECPWAVRGFSRRAKAPVIY